MKKIIITLTDTQQKQFYDIEVPVQRVFNQLSRDIIDTLNGYMPYLAIEYDSVAFVSNRTGKQIAPNETLEDAGIWNGDYVTIIEA